MVAGDAKDAGLYGNLTTVVVGETGFKTGEEGGSLFILLRHSSVSNITGYYYVDFCTVGTSHLDSIGHLMGTVDNPSRIIAIDMQIRKM